MTSTDGQHFQSKWILNEYSLAGPALSVFYTGSVVALAWTGTDRYVNTYFTSDGINFSNKKTYTNAITNYGPAIVFKSSG